ncbi:MAG TPA: IS630 family transposase [Candidatus Synoicihabitans sp.]|nr:IS630 family transposase [Candidatus Synoicihabitans sp.]
MERPIERLEARKEQRAELERLVRASTTPQRIVRRARIVLERVLGRSQQAAGEEVGASRPAVIRWERRFASGGVAGLLKDAPGRGAKPSIPEETKAKLITQATQPPPNRTRWSVRANGARGWRGAVERAAHLGGQRSQAALDADLKVVARPKFRGEVWDVIGLYLNSPSRALVLCCDEKSQCQALERSQRGLPLGPGYLQTATHDYIRHGTVTLFAALNYLDGRIISTTAAKHTHVEWLVFLKKLHRQTPKELDLHLIVDNYATHKHPAVTAWLQKHPRMHVHFTPTSSSWLNLVKRFFRQLTDDVVRDGSFASVTELITAINVHLAHHNLKPKPYRWRAEGAAILEKIQRARAAATQAVL